MGRGIDVTDVLQPTCYRQVSHLLHTKASQCGPGGNSLPAPVLLDWPSGHVYMEYSFHICFLNVWLPKPVMKPVPKWTCSNTSWTGSSQCQAVWCPLCLPADTHVNHPIRRKAKCLCGAAIHAKTR